MAGFQATPAVAVRTLGISHSMRSGVIRVTGQFLNVDPTQWVEEMPVTVSVGLGTGNRDQILAYLMQILQVQQQIVMQQQGLSGPLVYAKNVFDVLSKLCENAGYKEPFFADPTKIDPAMPCFRLGAFGTERERHKRVTGLFSCVFADKADGEVLLAAALWSQAGRSGLTHIAAQAPSDAASLCSWYDRFFQRQGSFPILSRQLSS